jgi:hypothetical protein
MHENYSYLQKTEDGYQMVSKKSDGWMTIRRERNLLNRSSEEGIRVSDLAVRFKREDFQWIIHHGSSYDFKVTGWLEAEPEIMETIEHWRANLNKGRLPAYDFMGKKKKPLFQTQEELEAYIERYLQERRLLSSIRDRFNAKKASSSPTPLYRNNILRRSLSSHK